MKDDASPPQRGNTPSWPTVVRLLASLALLGSVASACSDAASPAGYREYVPAGGVGGGGVGGGGKAPLGEGGDAGGDGAVEGGAPPGSQGGGGMSSGGGGSAGKGSTGGAGGGGGGPVMKCGNGTKDPGEECDDGNLLDLDGCSSVCKSKCETCLDTMYGDLDEYQQLVELYRSSVEKAIEGPALNQPRSVLAQELLRCIVQSGCILQDPLPRGACLCGTASNVECDAGKSDSPCLDAFAKAAESRDIGQIQDRISNTTLGVGWAVELAKLQGAEYCAAACKEQRDLTPCEVCLAGPERALAAPASDCTACLSAGACSKELIACSEDKCAGGDLEPCLRRPSAPGDPFVPAPCGDLVSSVDVSTPSFLRCRKSQCKDECAVP